jgi:hypothetical protein
MLAIPPTYGHWFFHRMTLPTGGVKVIGSSVTCDATRGEEGVVDRGTSHSVGTLAADR